MTHVISWILVMLTGLLIACCGAPPVQMSSASDMRATLPVALLPSTPALPAATTLPNLALTATTVPTVIPTATPVPTTPPTTAPSPIPTTRPEAVPPVRLVIDAIDLDRVLIPVGLDANRVPVVPDHDVGWYRLGAMPGQGDNIVLWGHVLRFRKTPHIPAPFARLKELSPGATVILIDERGVEHRYTVTRQVWATPDEVHYMLPQGREMVTMISCIGDKIIAEGSLEMTHRLITIAEPEGAAR
ncbi:MAG: class F sortase [Roseiflexus sp.]|jgi:sortase (surface protein transpeptidase)|nr:class F sortase [Roseiflexus sp.]MBO9334292.1 class F sortase [Roseiflexus sp.]MBO9365154.1 class F sortase [Roseiflexus sp.]MBO9382864.1 class F sortase [Roseiflexus sp.]MBO9389729.1 class F sortase [Roseiflexus sp.]